MSETLNEQDDGEDDREHRDAHRDDEHEKKLELRVVDGESEEDR